MFRRFLGLLAVAVVAPAAAAQPPGLTSLFATGPAGGDPSGFAFSYHRLPANPVALALTQFTVVSSNPAAVTVTCLNNGLALALNGITPASPYILNLTGGGAALGGGPSPSTFALFPLSNPDTTPASGFVPNLSITLTTPENGKAGSVSYLVTDPDTNTVGGATLGLPADGWWVLGFGTVGLGSPDPQPQPDPEQTGPITPTANDPVQTPEPATLLLAGVGLAGAGLARRRRGRAAG